jgi:hypothetical protein
MELSGASTRCIFRPPIDKTLVFEIDVLSTSPQAVHVIEYFGNLTREGFEQSSMTAFFQQRQAMSKFALAALLTSESMLQALRREIRRFSSGCRVEVEDLKIS